MMKWFKKKWNKQAKNPLKNRKIIGAFLFTVTIGAYLVIGARFSWIMVSGNIAGQDLDQNVQQLYSSENVVQAERGTIFDRNGNPIATDANS
ncbi:cell division protein FtsI, partial [Klebsiella oxytoca]